jgi:hypothetical protein
VALAVAGVSVDRSTRAASVPRVPAIVGLALLLAGCAVLAPVTRAPGTISDEDLAQVTTRDEAIRRFGQPAEIRASDVGAVLVYRRTAVVDINPNRFYGPDYQEQYRQYDVVLLYLDGEGKIVRRTIDRE